MEDANNADANNERAARRQKWQEKEKMNTDNGAVVGDGREKGSHGSDGSLSKQGDEDGDDLFPTLDNNNNDTTELIADETTTIMETEEEPTTTTTATAVTETTSFDEAKSKIGNLFAAASRSPTSASSSLAVPTTPVFDPADDGDDDMVGSKSSPILLPPSSSSSSSSSSTLLVSPVVANNDDDVPITSSSAVVVVSAPKRKRRPIPTGLGNLGNTCFMNSTLQCLAHTPPLRHYFLSGKYKDDLNKDNPLGTGGELAKEFANLLGEMWLEEETAETSALNNGGNINGSSSSNGNGIYSSSRIYSPGNGGSYYNNNSSFVVPATYPRSFKSTLGKHASQFIGYDQHDSQELATYLLDALHEDTNRVNKKPYVTKPEQAQDESDEDAANKAWSVHLQREDSKILEICMGQIKSKLVCPMEGCGRVSTTFDPCMYLSVPIPGSTDRTMKVVFVPLRKEEVVEAAELVIKLNKNSNVSTLRKHVVELARLCYGYAEDELCEEDVLLADVWQQKVWSYYDNDDYAIDGIKDNDVTYAYQAFPLKKVKDEVVEYKKRLKEEEEQKRKKELEEQALQEKKKTEDISCTPSASFSPTPLFLDSVTKAELDKDNNWENKLSGSFLAQPHSIYRILNEIRSSHEDKLEFYRKLLKFILKCKQCSDATITVTDCAVGAIVEDKKEDDNDAVMTTAVKEEAAAEEASDATVAVAASPSKNASEQEQQTLDEVCYTSHQFKGVRTPHDLAVLEYCASKLMSHISELKKGSSPSSTRKKNNKDIMSEDGIVVQIKIKKSDTSLSYNGGSNYHGKSSSTAASLYSWKIVGDSPMVARISPTLTVEGLRQMLGRRFASALKLKTDEHHLNNGIETLSSSPLSSSPEMGVMRQVALSCENGSGSGNNRSSNHRYHGGTRGSNNDDIVLGSVTMDHLTTSSKPSSPPAFAKSSDDLENELVASIVGNEGTILVNWPAHLNDIFEEDILFAKEEFLTNEQRKEIQMEDENGGPKKGVSVMDCIAKYCETEQLDESDMWYCNKCKDHVRAWKQFHLYRAPPILIVHLKRFHFSSTTHRRDKIDTLIDFPLTDLDLRGVAKQWDVTEGGGQGQENEPIYDCYAVSNHFGGLGGGHYTAYAKSDDGKWCNFDDSRVSTDIDESEVVSSAAYCLYFKRKDVGSFEFDDVKDDHDDNNEEEKDDVMTKLDNMEVDNSQDHSGGDCGGSSSATGSVASYRTPNSASSIDTDDGMMDDGDNSLVPPAKKSHVVQ